MKVRLPLASKSQFRVKKCCIGAAIVSWVAAVSLEAAAGETFKGFMIQARAGTGADLKLVGTFLQRDGYRTLGCSLVAVRRLRQ